MPVDVPCTRPKPVSYRTKGCHATWYQRDDPCSSVWLSHHETNACDYCYCDCDCDCARGDMPPIRAIDMARRGRVGEHDSRRKTGFAGNWQLSLTIHAVIRLLY
jgi:hypothetical protein